MSRKSRKVHKSDAPDARQLSFLPEELMVSDSVLFGCRHGIGAGRQCLHCEAERDQALHHGHVRAATLEEVEAAGGYQVIYSDPPWSYDQKVRVTLDAAQYSTMSVEALHTLPMQRLAARDCALFLWATWPNLPMALDALHAWGFCYKTLAFVWVKRNAKAGSLFWGAGSWTRANTEPCLLATRGAPKRVDAGVHQVLEDLVPEEVLDAERPGSQHSAKPVAARERIVKLLGDVSRLEMFARSRAVGFDAFGNDPALSGSDVVW